jgi:hypothetical protein
MVEQRLTTDYGLIFFRFPLMALLVCTLCVEFLFYSMLE